MKAQLDSTFKINQKRVNTCDLSKSAVSGYLKFIIIEPEVQVHLLTALSS